MQMIHAGTLRVSSKCPSEAHVSCEGFRFISALLPLPLTCRDRRDILIQGLDCNRAFHGDRVAVQLFPYKQWPRLKSVLMRLPTRLSRQHMDIADSESAPGDSATEPDGDSQVDRLSENADSLGTTHSASLMKSASTSSIVAKPRSQLSLRLSGKSDRHVYSVDELKAVQQRTPRDESAFYSYLALIRLLPHISDSS